jgi:LacI family transcriptional regulator
MRHATQTDIAKVLNISRTTVARALNDSGYVDADLKEAIIRTAEQLGYKVNPIARTLAMKKERSIYCLLVSYNTDFANKLEDGIRAAENEFSHYGIKVNIIKNNPERPQDQLKALKNVFKDNTVEGLIIAPLLNDEIDKILQESAPSNLPIASINLHMTNEKSLFYVGSDHYKGGIIAADVLAKLIGKEGKIAIFNTLNEYESLYKRYNGFIKKITDFNKIEIVNSCYLNSLEEAYNLTKDILKEYSDLKGIYSNTEVVYIAKALEELGRTDVKVIGNDLNESVKSYIRNGYIEATLHQRPYFQGYLVGKYMFNYIINGIKPINEITYVGYDIVTETNLDVEDYFTILTHI